MCNLYCVLHFQSLASSNATRRATLYPAQGHRNRGVGGIPQIITVHLKFAKNMARFLIPFVALFAYANGFCMNMPGGIGEYHMECTTTSIGMCPYKYTYFLHCVVSIYTYSPTYTLLGSLKKQHCTNFCFSGTVLTLIKIF